MNKDKILKQIDCLRDAKTHLWTAVVVSAGGTLTLLSSLNTPLNITLLIIGILAVVVFLHAYIQKDIVIDKLFKKIEEEK